MKLITKSAPHDISNPEEVNLVQYIYNENSQVLEFNFQDEALTIIYTNKPRMD